MSKLVLPPKKFVGLHSHSGFSTFDAIGKPQEHIDYAISNGMDSLALTDHGTMSGFSHQYLHAKQINKTGQKFKPIFGVEAYFIPSLADWNDLHEAAQQKNKQTAVKSAEPGNEMASTEAELDIISTSLKGTEDADDDGGTIVENEEESKGKSKGKNPLYQRNHLVLLAKNDAGLKSLFRIVSDSAADGYYKYPRVDLASLKKHANGNIVASTACLAGFPAKIIFDHQTSGEWETWIPNTDNMELIQADLAKMIQNFREALGEENFNLELQFNRLGAQNLLNFHLMEAAKRNNCPLIVTVDAHYSHPDHWKEREIYKMMGRLAFMKKEGERDKLPEKEELKCELYPKNADQVWQSFKDYTANAPGCDFYDEEIVRNAIERTYDIAHDQIGTVEIDRKSKLPPISYMISKPEIDVLHKELGEDASEDDMSFRELKKVAIEGLKSRNKATDQVYIDRLKRELGDIKFLQENYSQYKIAKYFLLYKKIIDITSKTLFVGNGRGSVSGSLLAYCLGISQVDPIRFDTLWERFISRKKLGMPDIDQDWSERDEAVKIIQQEFGEENVIPVSNFAQLQLASLCKDLAKLFGVPFDVVNKYTGKMRNEALAVAKQEAGFDAQQWVFTLEVAQNDSPSYNEFIEKMEEYPEFKRALEVLFKQQRTVSRHAGGIVITDNSRENMPLIKAKGGLQTPWPEGLAARHLEDFGLLKFDILGLGTLKMFENVIRKILKKEGNKYPSFEDVKAYFMKNLHPDNNPMTDTKVYDNVFWQKHEAGIFQFVRSSVQTFMSEMKPTSIVDIAIATSIHRPGPLGLKADKLFLKNRKDPSKVKYVHPVIEEVLGYTGGLLIFQEQLQLIVHRLSGMPLDETDAIRKAFTKKDLANKKKQEKDIAHLRGRFITESMAFSGITENQASLVWEDFEKWTSYGFNKSHAVAYAITSWQCAWFLTYHPNEWITTYLDYCTTEKGKAAGQEDPKSVALSEARALGHFIAKPDINLSESEFTFKGDQIIPSFVSVKNVGKSVINELHDFRPYKTVQDLLVNSDGTWRHSKLNKRALSNLIKLGALETMDLVGDEEGKQFRTYKELHDVVIDHHDELKRISARKKNNSVADAIIPMIAAVQAAPKNDWTMAEKIDFSKELAGSVDLDLIVTPEITNYLGKSNIKPLDQWEDPGEFYWTIVTGEQTKPTKTGKSYLRVQCIGENGSTMVFNIWGAKGKIDGTPEFKPYTLLVGRWQKNDFGYSTFLGSLRRIDTTE